MCFCCNAGLEHYAAQENNFISAIARNNQSITKVSPLLLYCFFTTLMKAKVSHWVMNTLVKTLKINKMKMINARTGFSAGSVLFVVGRSSALAKESKDLYTLYSASC